MRKKILALVILSVICCLFAIGFSACEEKPQEHVHSFTEWKFDANQHWKICPEDGTAGEKSAHTFVNDICECGYQKPAPEVKYGSAEGTIHLLKGEVEDTDFSDVTVTIRDEGPTVALDRTTGKLTINNLVAGKDYTLTISKPDYVTRTITISAGENETVKIGGDNGIVVRFDRINMVYTVVDGAGYEAELLDGDKNVLATKTIAEDNTVTFEELSDKNTYYLSVKVFNVALEQEVEVNNSCRATVDFGSYFTKGKMPAKTIEFSSENGYAEYALKDVSKQGDFYFAAQVKVPSYPENLAEEVRFGFYLDFSGKKYHHTFLTENNAWRMQQMESWWGEQLPQDHSDALMGDGLIVAIWRSGETGEIVLFYGTSVDNMVRENRPAWTAKLADQQNAITAFGFAFWSDRGAYTAEVAPLGYGTTLGEALGVNKDVTVVNPETENGRIIVSGSKVYDNFVLEVQPETDCILKSLTVNEEDVTAKLVDGKLVLLGYNQETLAIAAEFERTIYGQIDANAVVRKHGVGTYAVSDGTEVTLQNGLLGSFTATVTDGKISLRVPVGEYVVSANGYDNGSVIVTESGVTSDVCLEYKMFGSLIPTWSDTENFDASNVNAENASFTQNGRTLEVITFDSYDDVAVTMHIKAVNTTHVNKTQGIVIKYADGKSMIFDIVAPNINDARIMWEKNGIWGLQQAANENKHGSGWELGAPGSAGHFNRPFPQATWDALMGDGFDMTVVRSGKMLYIYVDNAYAGKFEVPEEYTQQKVQVGFFSYDCVANATWNFQINTDISAYNQQVAVSVSPSENGNVTLDKENVVLGDRVTITLTPDAYYKIATLTVDGEDVTSKIANGSYTFEAMKASYAVAATFEAKQDAECTVAISGHKYGVEGNSIPDGTEITFEGGAAGTYTATVSQGKVVVTLGFGTYAVKLDGYVAKTIEVSQTGADVEAITLEYDLMYNVASTWGWGDEIDFANVNDGRVTKAESSGVLYAATKAQYDNVAITTTFVENGGGRQGAFVKFGNDYVLVQLEPGSGDNAGKYKITWNAQNPCGGVTSVLTGWAELVGYGYSSWTDEMTAQLQAGTLKVTLLRKDSNVFAIVGGKVVGQAQLKDAQIEKKCEVGVYIQSAPKDRAIERDFVIEEDVSAYTISEQFSLHGNVDQSRVAEGILIAKGGMEVTSLATYHDMTAEFSWKYPGTGTRYGFALVFGDGTPMRFDVRFNDNGKYDIQRCGWGNLPGYGWQDGVATYDVDKYQSEGLSFKVVRQGSSVKIWLDGTLIVDYANVGDAYADDAIRLRFNTEGATDIHYTVTDSVEA